MRSKAVTPCHAESRPREQSILHAGHRERVSRIRCAGWQCCGEQSKPMQRAWRRPSIRPHPIRRPRLLAVE